ncbi:hypothetical protein [Streptomyces sp. KMM 9044]|uniref:hypothetical protein n=1 Tax=Streptomyces sp. KMM 9044 TaxID=2744474 RepID=UPI003FA69075
MIVSFGLALARLGVDVRTLTAAAPPPHQVLLALLARVLGGSPEVYGEIQWSNPRVVSARRALDDALRSFASFVGDDPDPDLDNRDGDGHRGATGLGGVFEDLRDSAAQLPGVMTPCRYGLQSASQMQAGRARPSPESTARDRSPN